MKRRAGLSLVLVGFMAIAAVFGGCGSKEEEKSYQEVLMEKEQLSYGADQVDTSDMIDYVYLGSQFHEGERVQIWGERKQEGGNVYLHREDGSRELLAEGVEGYYINGTWWIDRDKRCYSRQAGIRRISEKGDIVFEIKDESAEGLYSFCQLEDGRIVLLRSVLAGQGQKVTELNPESGSLTDIANIPPEAHALLIAAEGNGLVLLDNQKGIWDMNLTEGTVSCRIPFEGTSYVMPIDINSRLSAFRLLEDGGIEILRNDGTAETLKLEDIGAERELLVLRMGYNNSWLKGQITKFNQKNNNYYIVVEECEDTDERQSFTERTELELGTGKGADIIHDSAITNVYALLEKGVFADLTPFMEESGIREDDYFPVAFSSWKNKSGIYGLSYANQPQGIWMEQSVTGGAVPSDMEELLDYLLAYEKDATFFKGSSAKSLLAFFLRYSESLCGMVDFEEGDCNFQGELFEKLLKAAKKYGYDEPKNTAEPVAGRIYYENFYYFYDRQNLADMERTPLGYWFNDGWYALQTGDILAINNASTKKEGAWEFLQFLLSDEAQLSFSVEFTYVNWAYFPVSRDAFQTLCVRHSVKADPTVDPQDDEYAHFSVLTEDRKQELEAVLEGARPIPLRTQPLLEIILDEAEAYFTDTKSIDEVRNLIENRVRLYLAEQK